MVNKVVVLRKRAVPKVVNLPNWKSFTSRWERISKRKLPINIKVVRKRTIGPRKNNRQIYLNLAREGFKKIKIKRKQDILNRVEPIYNIVYQSGKGLAQNLIKTGFDLGSRVVQSEFGKKIINKGIGNIPNIFKFGVSKIKNKKVQDALSSDIAEMVVDEAQNRAKNSYSALFD